MSSSVPIGIYRKQDSIDSSLADGQRGERRHCGANKNESCWHILRVMQVVFVLIFAFSVSLFAFKSNK